MKQRSAAEAKALLQAQINGELPDARGRFGPFGGRYVPETLVPAFDRLEQGVREFLHDEDFQAEFRRALRETVDAFNAACRPGRFDGVELLAALTPALLPRVSRFHAFSLELQAAALQHLLDAVDIGQGSNGDHDFMDACYLGRDDGH